MLFRETRYLLFLTENYSALRILQQANLLDHDPLILFGSSFPEDLNYTQVTSSMYVRIMLQHFNVLANYDFLFSFTLATTSGMCTQLLHCHM